MNAYIIAGAVTAILVAIVLTLAGWLINAGQTETISRPDPGFWGPPEPDRTIGDWLGNPFELRPKLPVELPAELDGSIEIPAAWVADAWATERLLGDADAVLGRVALPA